LTDRVLKRVYNAGDPRLGAGATAFMRAARSGDVAVMRLLLDHGADPLREQKNGNTPITLAASLTTRGNYPDRGSEDSAMQAITLCLERGLDINRANATGDTAVHLAVGSAAMIRFLAAHGARLDIKNQRGLTPLAAAGKNRTADPRAVSLLSELTGVPAPAATAAAVGAAGADN
jgi:ankyrin repeat protein